MKAKVIGILREYIFGLSLITSIVGLIILIISLLGLFYENVEELLNISESMLNWFLYLLIIGLIIFGIGLYYIYVFITSRNFVLKEIDTKKRSEFIKKHNDVKNSVRNLPSKYKKMLKEKEDELNIK